MKNSRSKKFISLLIIVLVLSLIAPAVFAAKPTDPKKPENKPVKPTFTYALTSVTGGGHFDVIKKDVVTDKCSFGFNIRQLKSKLWAVNLTFVDSVKANDKSDNTIVKVRIRDLKENSIIFDPLLKPASFPNKKPETQKITIANVPAKIKLGGTDKWESCTVSLEILAADKTSNSFKISYTIDSDSKNPKTVYTFTGAPIKGGNITAHYKRVKVPTN